MSKQIVGTINDYEVIYVPEKDVVFCKNTAVPFLAIQQIVKGSLSRGTIPEKSLTITKDNGIVCLGCLTTTMTNMLSIEKQIIKLKKSFK